MERKIINKESEDDYSKPGKSPNENFDKYSIYIVIGVVVLLIIICFKEIMKSI